MAIVYFILLCFTSQCLAEPEPQEILREEIESAAIESRHLADELGAMLARLEAEEEQSEAVEAAVLEEQEVVEEALKEMVDKIEDLARASEDTNLENIAGLVSEKRVEESELRKTLEQLELLAQQIEETAASADYSDDEGSIDKIAKLLQSVSDRIRTNSGDNGEDEEEFFTSEFSKDQSETGLKLNGLNEMIKSLEKVTNDLNGNDEDDSIGNDVGDADSSRSRKGKQLDLESEVFDLLEDVGDDEYNDEDEKKPRKPKQNTKEDNEVCEEEQVSDSVKVCVPDFKTVNSQVSLYSAVVQEEKHCFEVTKTICEESSAIVSKEVCIYDYQQKSIVAPAQMTEVTFERRHEKFGVTHCTPGVYHKEDCVVKYEEVPYRVPSVADYIDDFIELNIPEPRKSCRVFKYEIPEVTCKDVTNEECVDVAFLEPSPVIEDLETVVQTYEGDCEQRTLEQTQQICTKEKRVKQHKPSYRGY